MYRPIDERINNASTFMQRKTGFFVTQTQIRRNNLMPQNVDGIDALLQEIEDEANRIAYSWLDKNKSFFEIDYNTPLHKLNLHKEEELDYLLWCYFCACMQERYFTDYRKTREAKNIRNGLKENIRNYWSALQIEANSKPLLQKIKDAFLQKLKMILELAKWVGDVLYYLVVDGVPFKKGDFYKKLISGPIHLSDLRSFLGLFNMFRLE
jgi:hypothetical protein